VCESHRRLLSISSKRRKIKKVGGYPLDELLIVMSRRAFFFFLVCYLASSTHALIKYDSTYLITPGIKKAWRHLLLNSLFLLLNHFIVVNVFSSR